jgi:hypothetical protein
VKRRGMLMMVLKSIMIMMIRINIRKGETEKQMKQV